MTEKEISHEARFERFGNQEVSRESYQRKPYKKPILQPLNTPTDLIAGGDTSNQLEASSGFGLIGS